MSTSMAHNLSNFEGREMMLNLHDHVLNMKSWLAYLLIGLTFPSVWR